MLYASDWLVSNEKIVPVPLRNSCIVRPDNCSPRAMPRSWAKMVVIRIGPKRKRHAAWNASVDDLSAFSWEVATVSRLASPMSSIGDHGHSSNDVGGHCTNCGLRQNANGIGLSLRRDYAASQDVSSLNWAASSGAAFFAGDAIRA